MKRSDYPVQVSSLTKRFGKTTALSEVSLRLAPGTVTGLLGRNGAGKTTFIKCLLGLLQPTEGQSLLFGDDSRDLSPTTKGRIGYVPQEPSIYPWMRTKQAIAYQGAFYAGWDDALAGRLLSTFKLDADKRVGTLSVGQLQKLAILLALCSHPDLLILDEPVAALDPEARRDFLLLLIDLVADDAHTVLFSTHITSDVERVCSHVAVLKEGTLMRHDDLDSLRASIKELRLISRGPIPEASLRLPGVLRHVLTDRGAVLTVEGNIAEVVARLRADTGADITVVDLNLEDLFIELHQ